MPQEDLTGRVAIVTGASRGIGQAIALALINRGAKVVVSSRKQSALEALANEINSEGSGRAVPIAAHVGKPDQLAALVEETLRRLGRIDILVNNAATNPYFGPTLDADISVWDKTINVNFMSAVTLINLVVKAWMADHGGVIANVASISGLTPGMGVGIYGVSKAMLISLTAEMAHELAPHNIRINAVAPNVIKTDFAEALWGNPAILERILRETPMARIGTVEEVADTVAFLVSDRASYITGQTIAIDGGATASPL